MKFVENADLERYSSKLCFDAQDTCVIGNIDLFTTKPATSDRKLIRTLDKQLDCNLPEDEEAIEFVDRGLYGMTIGSVGAAGTLESSALLSPPSSFDRKKRANSATLPFSPFGPMDQGGNRKQYAYLISVLNASDPDRDFSSLHPDNFTRELSMAKVMFAFNTILVGLGSQTPAGLWETLDKQVELKDCKIYSLVLPQNFLQDDPGTTWCKMWFFFNKRRKRVMFIHLKTCRPYSPEIKPDQTEDYDLTQDEVPVLGEMELGLN